MDNKRQLEKIFKGVANHKRVEILFLIDKKPLISVLAISKQINSNYKSIAEHIRKMHLAKLIFKNSSGNQVCLTLSPLGKTVLQFCRKLE